MLYLVGVYKGYLSMKIAIIPARGGSKRIPQKNIKLFCGKPIIAYSIEAALASGCFERVIVSTDNQEIADIALQYGAEVPFFRPACIADDYATTIEVIQHAIITLALEDSALICCLYATAPFVTPRSLVKGLEMLTAEGLDYCFSATEFTFPIQRAFRLNQTGRVEMFQPEYFNTRSQDLESAYHDAGQFYWGTYGAFSAGKPIFSSNAKPLILNASQVQDIDTNDDWNKAVFLYELLRRNDTVDDALIML